MTERMTAAAFRAGKAIPAKPRKSKFNAKRVIIDGITFASQKEANRYAALKQMEKAGLISHLELQPSFKLYCGTQPVLIRSKRYPNGRHATYRADFAYFDADRGKRIVEDAKGFRTKEFILKRAVVEACFPAVQIEEI